VAEYNCSIIKQYGGLMMNPNEFFKPTPLYKEFMILDLIAKEPDITQRVMSRRLNVSVSMINTYLDTYESQGFIKRDYVSSKDVNYTITKKGIERNKILNFGYLKASQEIHRSAEENIISFLNQIITKGFKKIILYGAGEIAESLLQVIQNDNSIPITAVAIIDDDSSKQGLSLVNIPIVKLADINLYLHDGILVSSYTNNEKIYQNLLSVKYEPKKIIRFFDK
jgi:DNA-binding MarR family transcriptional regulator